MLNITYDGKLLSFVGTRRTDGSDVDALFFLKTSLLPVVVTVYGNNDDTFRFLDIEVVGITIDSRPLFKLLLKSEVILSFDEVKKDKQYQRNKQYLIILMKDGFNR